MMLKSITYALTARTLGAWYTGMVGAEIYKRQNIMVGGIVSALRVEQRMPIYPPKK